jgi:putative endonuclease
MSRAGSKQQVGVRGEELAVAELQRQGMTIVARNWRCSSGEIDIIAVERVRGRTTLVFCEVKCRTGLGFGHPLEAITWAKIRRLRQLAAEWLAVHESVAGSIRLDAVGVVLLPGQPPELTHVRAVGA